MALQAEGVRLSALLRGVGILASVPLLLLGLLAYFHVAQANAPRRPGPLPALAIADVTAHRLAIQRSALDAVNKAAARADHSARSHVVRVSGERATLVLTPRPRPYRALDLLQFPRVAIMTHLNRLIIRRPIVVSKGTQLILNSGEAPNILLSSSNSGFASIVGLGGTIRLEGRRDLPLRVSTLDSTNGTPDQNIRDGRSFILSKFGRMNVTHARISYLGFGEGIASGVAWSGKKQAPVHGVVSYSSFSHNHFGAYTFEARRMQWTHNVFSKNDAYGFDPHDYSNRFTLRDNLAYGNGRHGFIFSRGCQHNTIIHNTSRDNRGHGFMIDDGNNDVARGSRRWIASSYNMLKGNEAVNNGRSGIEIEGGRGNIVRRNVVVGNDIGIRYRLTASGIVSKNRIEASRLYGIDVESSAGMVHISRNVGTGSWSDLTLDRPALVTENQFAVVQGESTRNGRRKLTGGVSQAASFLDYHPGIVVWLVILWLPLASLLWHLLRLRPHRRRPAGRHAAA